MQTAAAAAAAAAVMLTRNGCLPVVCDQHTAARHSAGHRRTGNNTHIAPYEHSRSKGCRSHAIACTNSGRGTPGHVAAMYPYSFQAAGSKLQGGCRARHHAGGGCHRAAPLHPQPKMHPKWQAPGQRSAHTPPSAAVRPEVEFSAHALLYMMMGAELVRRLPALLPASSIVRLISRPCCSCRRWPCS